MKTASLALLRTALLLSLAVVLAACTSGPPRPIVDYRPDYDFSRVNKIAFHRESGQVSGDNPMQLSDMQRERIDTAMSAALQNLGLQLVDDAADADLLLSWHLVTQHQTDVRQTGGFGYGYGLGYGGYYGRGYGYYGAYGPYACDYGFAGRTEVYSQNYTKGKFIVDMIDPTLDKSVWRGITESRLKSEPVKDQAKYNEAAAAILASFPPR